MESGLEANGVEDAADFFLGDSDIDLSYLNGTMVKDFVEEDKTFGAMVVGVVNIAAKGFAERMGREVLNLQMVFLLELLQPLIYPLDSHGLIASV